MRDAREQIYLEYEINKHHDFFELMQEVCCGIITRRHLMVFYPVHEERYLKEWKRLGIIENIMLDKCLVYRLKYVNVLGISTRPKLTASLLLRSNLRLEHYLSLGLDTPGKILAYARKGNDRTVRVEYTQRLMETYQEALMQRTIEIPELDNPDNAKTLIRLTNSSLFLSKLQFKDGVLVPQIIYYAIRSWTESRMVVEIIKGYREIQAMFSCQDGPAVQPVVTICYLEGNHPEVATYRRLHREPEFLTMSDSELSEVFQFQEIRKPFPRLDTGNLL